MTLGPVVAGPGLAEHEVVRPEDLAERSRPDAVHGAGLQVHQHGPRHVLPPAGLVVVDVDPLQLEVRVSMVGTSGVDAVLIGDDLPELRRHSLGLCQRKQQVFYYFYYIQIVWYTTKPINRNAAQGC